MNILIAFILGLLLGWLIEWIIDWFYWRRRYALLGRDNFKLIKGIGPVIQRKLYKANITTFEQLGKLKNTDLEAIIGEDIRRLADEKSLILQARDLAEEKTRGEKKR